MSFGYYKIHKYEKHKLDAPIHQQFPSTGNAFVSVPEKNIHGHTCDEAGFVGVYFMGIAP